MSLISKVFAVLTIALVLFGCETNSSQANASDGINMEVEIANALSKGKPVMLDFGSEGCPSCVQMKPTVYRVIRDYRDSIEVVMIDVNLDRQLAAKYKIRPIPAYIFFDANGNEKERLVGFMDPKIFIEFVEEFIKEHS